MSHLVSCSNKSVSKCPGAWEKVSPWGACGGLGKSFFSWREQMGLSVAFLLMRIITRKISQPLCLFISVTLLPIACVRGLWLVNSSPYCSVLWNQPWLTVTDPVSFEWQPQSVLSTVGSREWKNRPRPVVSLGHRYIKTRQGMGRDMVSCREEERLRKYLSKGKARLNNPREVKGDWTCTGHMKGLW